jgi:dethiobiotin synthetase
MTAAGVFVTGTGTGVGKTVVAAVLARTLAAQGRRVAVFKPAVTGLEVASVVLTPWPQRPSGVERSNRETIASLGAVAVQTLPRLDLAAPIDWPMLQVTTNQPRDS